MAVWGPMNSGLAFDCELRENSQISAKKRDCADRSAVLSTLSNGLDIELSDFEAENAMLKGDSLWQVDEIMIRGIATILEIRFM
jgi:hypothetical protein